eukprot:COSAG02_NODE_1133_length_14390_cov_3.493178_14_plen_283_part_00
MDQAVEAGAAPTGSPWPADGADGVGVGAGGETLVLIRALHGSSVLAYMYCAHPGLGYVQMRESILSSYDPTVPGKYPTVVSLGLNVFKVTQLTLASHHFELSAWIRASWVDPRLDWTVDPDWDAHINFTNWVGDNPERLGQVWVPNFELYNSAESISADSNTIREIVYGYRGGYVYWSRPGVIKSLCSWDGLVNWPFGELTCELEFGGWDRSAFTVDYQVMNPAVEFGGGDTSSDRFSEYKIVDHSVSRKEFYYSCCPDEPWYVTSAIVSTTSFLLLKSNTS